MNMLVSGSLVHDTIVNFPGKFSDHILPDKIHQLNLSFVTNEASESFGGCAGNIAYNLALLGERAMILSSVGRDFTPYREHLLSHHIDLTFVKEVTGASTCKATAITDMSDNQIFALVLGAMTTPCDFKESDLPEGEAMAVIAPGNVDDMRRLPEIYRKTHTPFMFDPGQQIAVLSSDDLKNGIRGARVVIANDYELSLMSDKTGWREEDILDNATMLVTTLGEEGSRIRTREKIHDIPAAQAEQVVDPTGAGDAYRAGFIAGLIKQWPLETCGRFAATVAAYAVEAQGPQNHTFTSEEVRGRYVKNFGTIVE